MPSARDIRAGRAFVEVGINEKVARALKRIQARLRAFGDGVRSIGQRMVGASAAAITPLAASTVVFAGFEQRMARVQALTEATGKDFKRLSDEAKRLGESTVFSASQAAEAMSFFALAGFDVEQILKAIGPTLNLAAAGQLEIAQAADIAAKIMAGMGMEAEDLGYAVDVLTKAMTTANTDLGQLGDAMKFVGPIAKSAKIAFEEVVAAIQLMSNAGIQGEMAGTTLRGALLQLTSPSKEAADKLKELGVSVSDAQGNVRPLADIIEDLNRATQGMGTGKRLEVLGTIFSARQAGGMAELLSQGADKLREYTAALGDSGGTAARIAGVQLNTLKGDATILKSTLEGLAIAVGESLAGPLRVLTSTVKNVVGAAAKWVRENRDLVLIAGVAAVAIGAFGVGLVALGVTAQVVAFVFGGLASILAVVKTAFLLVGGAIAGLFSPIGLIIAAVTALGTTVVVYTGAAGKAIGWLGEQFGRLREFVTKVVGGISDALAAGDVALAAKVMWLGLKLAWQQGADALNRVWQEVKKFFVQTAYDMWYGALTVAEYAWHRMRIGWAETVAAMADTWALYSTHLKRQFLGIFNGATKLWNHLRGLFDEAFDVDEANAFVDRVQAAAVSEIERRRDADLRAIEEDVRSRRAEADDEYQMMLGELRRQWVEAGRSADQAAAEGIARTREELEKARAELNAAIAQARQKREEFETEGGPPGMKKGDPLAELQKRLEGLGDAVAQKISVTGTFNPLAAQGLGAGNALEDVKRTNQEIAKHTKRLAEAVANRRQMFA